MTILKDAQYWREYNQKRRQYLLLKKRQSRAKLKGLVVDQKVQRQVVDQLMSTTKESVQPKESVVDINQVVDDLQPEPVIDLEAFNQEVCKRAGTRDPKRFFTFPDGRKIVRTRCGCNSNNQGFYDWCLDSCDFFTHWREKAINYD